MAVVSCLEEVMALNILKGAKMSDLQLEALIRNTSQIPNEMERLKRRVADLESSVTSLQEQLLIYQNMFGVVTNKIEDLENRLGGEG